MFSTISLLAPPPTPDHVRVPVKAIDGLGRERHAIDELQGSGHALLPTLVVLDFAGFGIAIFPQIETSVASSRHKDIAVLRQMRSHPNCGFVALTEGRVGMMVNKAAAEKRRAGKKCLKATFSN